MRPYPNRTPRPTSLWAGASLACGLAGFFILQPVGGVLAIVFAVVADREIQESNGYMRGRTLAHWGMACGVAGLAFFALLALPAIIMLVPVAHR